MDINLYSRLGPFSICLQRKTLDVGPTCEWVIMPRSAESGDDKHGANDWKYDAHDDETEEKERVSSRILYIQHNAAEF